MIARKESSENDICATIPPDATGLEEIVQSTTASEKSEEEAQDKDTDLHTALGYGQHYQYVLGGISIYLVV